MHLSLQPCVAGLRLTRMPADLALAAAPALRFARLAAVSALPHPAMRNARPRGTLHTRTYDCGKSRRKLEADVHHFHA